MVATFWLLFKIVYTSILTMTSFMIACTSFYLHFHLLFFVYVCVCVSCLWNFCYSWVLSNMHVVRTTKTVMCSKRFCTHTNTQKHTLVFIRGPRNFNKQIGAIRKTETSQFYCSIHGCWLSAIISYNTCDDDYIITFENVYIILKS